MWVIVDAGILNVALECLRRDAKSGQAVRAEIAAELEKTCHSVPECFAPNPDTKIKVSDK